MKRFAQIVLTFAGIAAILDWGFGVDKMQCYTVFTFGVIVAVLNSIDRRK